MTIHVSDSVVIARSAAEVFAFVADHQNLPAWTVGVRTSQRVEGLGRRAAEDRRPECVAERLQEE